MYKNSEKQAGTFWKKIVTRKNIIAYNSCISVNIFKVILRQDFITPLSLFK